MKKLLMSFLLIFCIGCTFTFNETNINISAKSTKETIMIDAGHGGYDVGAKSFYGDYEKDINLDIALLVGKQLKSYGYNVVYTRTSDSVSWPSNNKKDLQARCDLAKKKNADLFVSIHLNSSEYEANGYEIYCDFNNKNTVKLSNSILKQDKICQGVFLQKSTRSQNRYTYIDNIISVVKLEATVILSTTAALFKIAFYILCKQ